MSDRRRREAVIVSALLAAIITVPGSAQRSLPPASSFDLQALFERGPVLQDRNGDGVIDFVDARIVLSETTTASQVAAAAEVAARLGFETSAMNIPLPTGAGEAPVIVIGAAALARVGLDAASVGAAGLRPGEGVVAAATVNGRPGVVVTGGDEAGTRAAAQALAGRLPHVWDPGGPTVAKVAEEVRGVLAGQGVSVTGVSVPRAYVHVGGDAFARLAVVVQVASAADLTKGRAILRALRPEAAGASRPRAGAPGARGGAAAPSASPASEQTRLSYPGAQLLQVRLEAAGATVVEVELPRETAPEPGPLGRRPGSGPKENLDLSALYTNEGFFGDADNNLIPDRVDVVLSPAGEGIAGTVDLAARIGLEGTGLSVPLAIPAEALGKPEDEPTLVLIGTTHPLVEHLEREKKFARPALQAGEGWIQVVKKAFGEASVLIITGGDARGVARALRQVAERFPHVWARGKDRTTIEDIEEDVQRFLSARSPAGQAATALYKLDRLAKQLAGKELEAAHVLALIRQKTQAARARTCSSRE